MQYDYSKLPKHVLSIKALIGVYIAIGIAIIVGSAIGAAKSPLGSENFVTSIVVSGLFFVPLVLGVIYVSQVAWRNRRPQAFAKANNLPSIASSLGASDFPPIADAYGGQRNREFPVAYRMDAQGLPVAVYELTMDKSKLDARDSSTARLWVAKFELPVSFPHIFLNSKKNHFGDVYKSSQHVALEGNFDRYFNLFLPDGEQVDVLSIITPDVMQGLIDAGTPYDIEMKGNDVFIISDCQLFQREVLPHVLAFAAKLSAELGHRAVSWQEPLPGHAPQRPELVPTFIAGGGLQRIWVGCAIVFFIAAMLYCFGLLAWIIISKFI